MAIVIMSNSNNHRATLLAFRTSKSDTGGTFKMSGSGSDDAVEEVGAEAAEPYSGPFEELDRATNHGKAMHPQWFCLLQQTVFVQRLLFNLWVHLVQVHEY